MSEQFYAKSGMWWEPAIVQYLDANPGKKIAPACVKRVGEAISTFANVSGECWPSREAISERGRLSLRQVDRAIPILASLGIVTTYRRRRDTRGFIVHWAKPALNQDSPHVCESGAIQETQQDSPPMTIDGASQTNSRLAPDKHERGNLDSPPPRSKCEPNIPVEHPNDDDQQKREREIVASLTSRGIARSIAELAVRDHFKVAQAWATCRSWLREFANARDQNPEPLVTEALKAGALPRSLASAATAPKIFEVSKFTEEERELSERDGLQKFREAGKRLGWSA